MSVLPDPTHFNNFIKANKVNIKLNKTRKSEYHYVILGFNDVQKKLRF